MSRIIWTDGRGKEQSRPINDTLTVNDYKGWAGHPWLLIAANPQLSLTDLLRLFELHGIKRSRSWVDRRRWLFLDPDKRPAPRPSPDGYDSSALAVMRAHPSLSARKMQALLAEKGIRRSKDWVLRQKRE